MRVICGNGTITILPNTYVTGRVIKTKFNRNKYISKVVYSALIMK